MNTNDVLRSLSQGVNPVESGAPVYVANANPVGSVAVQPLPTAPTTAIDLTNMVQGACGIMALDIDNTSTVGGSTAKLLVFGLNAVDGADVVVKGVNGITSPLTIASSSASILVAPSKNAGAFTGQQFMTWLNEQFCCQNILFGNIATTDLGSTAGFSAFRKGPINVFSDNIGGNFANSNYSLKPDLCNPCFNSSDDIGLWEGKFPSSANCGFTLVVPFGVKAQLEFQVIATAKTSDFAACATI